MPDSSFCERLFIFVLPAQVLFFAAGIEGQAWLHRRSRRSGGERLLRLPSAQRPLKWSRTGIALSAFNLVVAFLGWVSLGEIPLFMVVIALWLPIMVVLHYRQQTIFHALAPLEICDRGILLLGNFLPWSRIRTYELRATPTDNRLLVLKGRQEFLGSIEVPNEYAGQVEQLIREHVGEAGAVAVVKGSSAW